MTSILENADPRALIGTASLACYLVYKRFEPNNPVVHAVLLLLAPIALVHSLSPQLSRLQQLSSVSAYWGLILAFTALYRLSPFHPLAKYPGPTLGKLSKFYWSYLAARGDAYKVLRYWHDKCGDVVRFGPNELSFRSADAIQPILGAKLMPKGSYYDTRKHFGDNTSTQLDGVKDFHVHGARRKPWNKAMSTSALKGYEPIIRAKTNELLEELAKRQGETVNLSQWMDLYAFDFAGSFVFNRDFGMLKAGEDVGRLIHKIEEGVHSVAVISHTPWLLPILQNIPAATKEYREVQSVGNGISRDRVKKGSTSHDLFYFLTEDEAAAQSGATHDEIVVDGLLAIVAGYDTTSTTLSHLWYFLLRHPLCAERLRKEIDAMFPQGEDPMDFSRHADMPYLNACINEALRLFPPVLSGLQRIVPPGSGGTMIGSHFVPESTQVSVHTYAVHRDAREFSPLPDVFWPDRWLTQNEYVLPSGDIIGKDQVVTNRAAWFPFSTGPQNCAGKALAMVEMRAVTCAMLHKFELRKPKDYDLDQWEKDVVDVYITLRGRLPMILVPRQVE